MRTGFVVVSFALIAVGLMVGGCRPPRSAGGSRRDGGSANYLPMLSRKAKLSSSSGYVYGQFHLEILGTNTKTPRVSIALQSVETGKKKRIMLNAVYPHFAVPITPGRYQITETMVSGRSNKITRDAQIDPIWNPKISAPFEVQAGRLCYIGDFYANVRMTGMDMHYVTHDVSKIVFGFDYVGTTGRFMAAFPNARGRVTYPAWTSL